MNKMNDMKFVETNRTGLFRKMNNGSLAVPKIIRENNDLMEPCTVEIIPMYDGFYVRKARGREK